MAVGVSSSLAGTPNQIMAPIVIEGTSCTGLLCRSAFHEGTHAFNKVNPPLYRKQLHPLTYNE